jgi:cysteinyl-tRNA synthetase
MLALYNTLTRKKEEFKSLKKNEVSLYTCGPTVYNFAHIGNLRTYIFEDLLKRVLLYNKNKIKHVMNITDVGHLTSDADTGEDKIEAASKKEHKTAWQIAEFYTKAFKDDMKKLNLLPPSVWCKATDHIKEQIKWVQDLEKAGYTYKTADGIYFNTSKFKDYGKLALLEKQQLQAGKRVAMGDKKSPTDFALWKFSSPEEKRQMEWNSPWGKGFPGWHIECSVMATKYLGKQFDIHCGGVDHIPIHHTNEIAQTEALTKKKWVNYWLHGEFLILEEEKMSKSKGNILTLSVVEEHGFSPLDYRYFCLNTHYRKQLKFSWEALEAAQNARLRMKEKLNEINTKGTKPNPSLVKKYKEQFLSSINDDLNMPEALAVLWGVLKEDNLSSKDILSLVKDVDTIFALDLLKKEKLSIPKEIQDLANLRLKYRKEKNFQKADEVRKHIESKGYIVEDQESGFRLKKQ